MSHPHPELSAPGPLAERGLRIIPLGGLGEVGRNMTVFEYDDRLLVVDCGVLFPEDHHPGVDLILPDGSMVHYTRTTPGNDVLGAIFEHTTTPTKFYKSTIVWNGFGWALSAP